MLLTGFHGGVVWDRQAKVVNGLARKDLSGSTLSEVRLRQDFIHLPVPFIGATRHDVLLRIANSEEMRSYRVGGSYDRPIARRMAEERGVPRQSFGQSKKGSSIGFGYLSLYWSKATLKDLRRFERRVLREGDLGPSYYARWAAQTGAQLAWAAIGKPAGRIGLGRPSSWLFKRLTGATTLIYSHVRYGSMATLWAIDKVRARYPTERQCFSAQSVDAAGATRMA